jgi:hypothetical protein
MRFHVVVGVHDEQEADFAQQTIHLLTRSYTWYGGLNGIVAGCGLAEKLSGNGDALWKNAVRQTHKQSVFIPQAEAFKGYKEMDEFTFKHKDGDHSKGVEEALASLDGAKQSLNDVLGQAAITCKSLRRMNHL